MIKTVRKANGNIVHINEKFFDQLLEDGDTVLEEQTIEAPVPTEDEVALMQRNRLRKNAKKYLADTDWYVTRKAETGTAIPEDILTKRAQARLDASE